MEIPFWILLPFVAMLLCIAIAPLIAEKEWEKNLNKFAVSMVLGSVVAIWMVTNNNAENEFTHKLVHQMVFDYVPFILLLTALFVVTGGIHVKGDIQATPKVNTLILAIGFVLASLMGTTGAAMLLIRPLLATNSQRKYTTHTILFFIALVANTGGLLTPLGDPPLFLLYLRGAEFTWFLSLLPIWAVIYRPWAKNMHLFISSCCARLYWLRLYSSRSTLLKSKYARLIITLGHPSLKWLCSL